MADQTVSPKQAVIAVMNGAAPERTDDIAQLWQDYDVPVVLIEHGGRITLNADKNRIAFDPKTMEVFWLIAFGGCKALECYSPLVICSAASGRTIDDLIKADVGLAQVERDYKERLAVARAFIEAPDPGAALWPPDIHRPRADRDASDDPQYRVAFDLACVAVAFALFHEFRHVMLERDNQRPKDLREEELACDVWAREFLTAKLASYAKQHGHDYHEVMRKRSMGLALAALILHEIRPVWDHGGNRQYFSIADRLRSMLDNTPLAENDHFAVLAASVLIGIFRQKHIPIDAPCMSACELTRYLIGKL
jgi:hypothetical protein